MWWLDDSSFREGEEKRRRVVYRRNVPLPGELPCPRRGVPRGFKLKLNLTEAQQAANQKLLEVGSSDESEITRLRREVASLQQTVCDQNLKLHKLAQHAARHKQRAASQQSSYKRQAFQILEQHRQQERQWNTRIADAEKVLHARELWLNEQTRQTNRLSLRLADAERQIAERDLEIEDMTASFDATRQQHADSQAELQQAHELDSRQLRAIAEAAEARAAERKAVNRKLLKKIQHLRAELVTRRAHSCRSNAVELDELTTKFNESEQRNSRLIGRVETLENKLRHARIEKDQMKYRNDAVLLEKLSAEQALRQSARARNEEVEQLRKELEKSRQQFAHSQSENDSISQTYQLLQCEQASVVIDLRKRLQTVVEQSAQFEQDAQQACQRAEELQSALEQEQAAGKERVTMLAGQVGELKKALEREHDEALVRSQKATSDETQLRRELDSAREQLDEQSRQTNEATAALNEQVRTLQTLVDAREQELKQLWDETQQKTNEIDHRDGSLERLRLKNERLVEIHDSQFNSMKSQIDEMVVKLDVEQIKRKRAEDEARRLSCERSERITFLAKQHDALTTDLEQLRKQNEALTAESEDLRRRPEPSVLMSLETQVERLRDKLQREAAGRRRAESALKRGADDATLDAAARTQLADIQSAEKVTRLKQHIKSLQKLCVVERHRAAMEIAKYKAEIESLQQHTQRRAA